ncbi:MULTISPECIES: hypothetical protein [unclassified Bradyrhizobium]|uniref:hypothetical protein n=1 Tax=unclassified Bradyrhizobium TaxID=2631580 RepID=UPI0028E2D087|nr:MULTISPECIES: hypothetical protein [unclassified Bradyrhizobium]
MRWLKDRINAYVQRTVANALAHATPKPEPKAFEPALDILVNKYGYGRTLELKLPVAVDGKPVPWYTYPALEYFEQLDARGLRIFEFGCGNSSLFWANKGAKVTAVEHDPAWFEKMLHRSSRLEKLILREGVTEYAGAISEIGGEFDVIIIDGVWRNQCARAALPHLSAGGCIVLDNSDWYTDVAEFFRGEGFLQVDFSGFGPINIYCWTTSLLVRSDSILNGRLNHPRPVGGIEACRGSNW